MSTTHPQTPTAALSAAGVSIWLDDLSRSRLSNGELRSLIEHKNVVGVTTNPTIFAAALADGRAYADQLNSLALAQASVEDAVFTITTDDVRAAADVFAPTFEATAGEDGRVSIEVSPDLAHDAAGTIAAAHQLWNQVNRPNTMIKIPATVPGLSAITEVIAAGISVNVTLIFSLERYRQVIDAYLSGLERAREAGIDLSTIRSVASFFVSRVDGAVDPKLDELDTEEAAALKGRAAIANARLAYEIFTQKFATDRATTLIEAGAHVQRPLWASTGVKDPALPDTLYVTELVAPRTVNTMPEKTLNATFEHAAVPQESVQANLEDARQLIADVRRLGIDLDKVTDTLEREGVEKFIDSWNELLATVEAALGEHRQG